MDIRLAEPDDAAQIARVHVRSWQFAYRGQIPRDYLDALDAEERTLMWRRAAERADGVRRAVLVAVDNGVLRGFASFGPTRDSDADPERVGEIQAIYLEPDAWSTGTGRALMTEVLGCLAGAGFGEVTLWVLDTNARARRFYEAAGLTADGAVQVDDQGRFKLTEVRYRRALP